IRLPAPDQLPVARPERVETPVVCAEEDPATVVRDRSVRVPACREGPHRLAVDPAEAVDAPRVITDVDPAADDDGRRLSRAEVLAPADAVRRAGGHRQDLAVSVLRGAPSARLPVEERLE